MIVQQKRVCQLRFSEAARGLGETRGCEIEQRQRNKKWEIVHARVEAPDESRSGDQLVVRSFGIGGKLRAESAGVPVFFHYSGQPRHSQQCEGKTGGKQRVDE